MVGDLCVSPIVPSNETLCPALPSLQWVAWASLPHLPGSYIPEPPVLCSAKTAKSPSRIRSFFTILLRYLDCCKETIGSPKFPGFPHERMPWSKTPVVSRILATPGLSSLLNAFGIAAFRPFNNVGFPFRFHGSLSLMSTIIPISGLNTEPATSLCPASDSRHRVGPRTSLPACQLNFSRVGLWLYKRIFFPTPEQALRRDDCRPHIPKR